uniref:Uncharacterized protein n=1 Tax=Avena sativa TaxID=4498 RepID=A0ACD5Z8J1_AVESA
MLDIPCIQKINLKFSAWIMGKVDVRSRSIVLKENKILRFWHQDVHKVFRVPCGPRNVMGRDANIRADAIEFIKNTLCMNQAGAHSQKAAENFLNRDITEESSKIEKDCFQIAFVIFVMGHILAPSTKHDYAAIDFWGALADTENIAQFNWCEYVMQALLDAVDKYQKDVHNDSQAINLLGCHLWLQHDVVPRIKAFEADWIRRLITMASDIGKGPRSYSSAPLWVADSVCYTRANFPANGDAMEAIISRLKQPENGDQIDATVALPPTSRTPALPRSTDAANLHQTPHSSSTRPLYAATDGTATGHTPTTSLAAGAMEYSTYLARQYPQLVAGPLTLMLKELNAKALLHIHGARISVLNDMFKFTEKLMAHLNTHCVCCNARGFSDCPLNPQTFADDGTARTPANEKLCGIRLDMSEGSTSRASGGAAKRPPDSGVCTKRKRTSNATGEPTRTALCRSANNIYNQVVSTYNSDEDNPNAAVVFGKLTTTLLKRHAIFHHSYAANPWRAGRAPPTSEAGHCRQARQGPSGNVTGRTRMVLDCP